MLMRIAQDSMSEALYISRARDHVASHGLSAHSGGITHSTRTLLASTEAVEPDLEVDKEDYFLHRAHRQTPGHEAVLKTMECVTV